MKKKRLAAMFCAALCAQLFADAELSLISAARSGNVELAKAFIAGGADLNAQGEDGATALIAAVESGNAGLARLLLEAGADRGIRDNYGMTALDYAEEGWESEIAEMLAR